ncbi:hypothetical protein BKA69DRAFT_1168485 [Paraphysoderma sedebokerense]|nr:hypothetical protein BKA69DRAFT_1168485 [Paraphysoderma sedebokerense]
MPTKVLYSTSSALQNTAHSSFRQVYTNACQSNKSFPLPSILNSQFDRSLELSFLGDKIQSELEWQLIIHALNEAKDLKGVVIWSTWLHEKNEKAALNPCKSSTLNHKIIRKDKKSIPPLILSSKLQDRICGTIQNCLRNSLMTNLEFSGIPFKKASLMLLAKGVSQSKTLRKLSLARCEIGDEGLSVIAPALRVSASLQIINVSACGLTFKSGSTLAEVIKYQSVRRLESQWAELLRKSPQETRQVLKTEWMSASTLKRLIVCNNALGDLGLMYLIETLTNDCGLKALDLIQNNITEEGASAVIELLKAKTELILIDLRNNNFDEVLLKNIEAQVQAIAAKRQIDVKEYILLDPELHLLNSENPVLETYHYSAPSKPLLKKQPLSQRTAKVKPRLNGSKLDRKSDRQVKRKIGVSEKVSSQVKAGRTHILSVTKKPDTKKFEAKNSMKNTRVNKNSAAGSKENEPPTKTHLTGKQASSDMEPRPKSRTAILPSEDATDSTTVFPQSYDQLLVSYRTQRRIRLEAESKLVNIEFENLALRRKVEELEKAVKRMWGLDPVKEQNRNQSMANSISHQRSLNFSPILPDSPIRMNINSPPSLPSRTAPRTVDLPAWQYGDPSSIPHHLNNLRSDAQCSEKATTQNLIATQNGTNFETNAKVDTLLSLVETSLKSFHGFLDQLEERRVKRWQKERAGKKENKLKSRNKTESENDCKENSTRIMSPIADDQLKKGTKECETIQSNDKEIVKEYYEFPSYYLNKSKSGQAQTRTEEQFEGNNDADQECSDVSFHRFLMKSSMNSPQREDHQSAPVEDRDVDYTEDFEDEDDF